MKRISPPIYIVFAAFVVYSAVSIIQHIHFKTFGYDLGLFEQVIWHYAHFQIPSSSIRGVGNILGDHFSPILIFLVPLYWIIPSPYSLLIAQAALLSLSVFPIYWFAEKKLGIKNAILISISYSIYWGIQSTVGFDFHEVAFAVPIISFALYAIWQKKEWVYIPLILLLLLVKEDMTILVAFLGIYLILKKEWKQGIILFISGVIVFYLLTKVVIPAFSGGVGYSYWNYSALGQDLPHAVLSIILHPFTFIHTLFTPGQKALTIFLIFLPLLFLSLFSPLVILEIPLLFERFLSSVSLNWSVRGHYTATITPVLFFAAIDALVIFSRYKLFSKIRIYLLLCILSINIASIAVFPFKQLFEPSSFMLSQVQQTGYIALSYIPSSASVIAQNPLVSHLAQRNNIYVIGYSRKVYDADYIIVSDSLDVWPLGSFKQIQEIINDRLQHGYVYVFNKDGWEVIKRMKSK